MDGDVAVNQLRDREIHGGRDQRDRIVLGDAEPGAQEAADPPPSVAHRPIERGAGVDFGLRIAAEVAQAVGIAEGDQHEDVGGLDEGAARRSEPFGRCVA